MGEFEVDATALFHADTEQGVTPIMTLSYNVTPAMRTPLLRTLAERGWHNPSALFEGRHASASGALSVRSTDGRTFRIEDGHDLLFDGVVVPPPGWTEHVRDLGAVGVLAGADLMSAPDWASRLPELAQANEILGSVATATLPAVVGDADIHVFARQVLSGLKPVLSADTLDDAKFAVEDDRPHDAVITAIRGAVTHQVSVPQEVFDMVHARALDGSSFGWKDTWVLKRLLRKARGTPL